MAVRFDADAEDYTRALTLGSQSALTMCSWYKISVDRNTWSTAWFIDNGQTDNWGVQTAEDGVTVGTVLDGNSTAGFVATVGTWYFIAFASSGTTGTFYYKAAGAASLSTVAISGVTATNAATLRLGESPWGAEWLNGCLAAVKAWNVQLTQAEIELEAAQYVPNRVSSLLGFYPLVRPETTDYSGNARTLSGGTNTATEDGPPIPWRGASPLLVLPATVAGGDATATPAVISCTAALPQPNVNIQAGPSVVAATAALPAVAVNVASGPSAIAATASIPAAGVNVVAGPSVLAATVSVPQPAVNVGAGPAVIPVTVSLPQATPQTGGNATATPAAIECTVTVPQPGINISAGPATVATLVTLPQSAVNVAAGPAVMPVTVTLPAGGVNSAASPTVVVASVSLPQVGVNVAAGTLVIPVTITLPQATAVDEGAQVNGTSTSTVTGLQSVATVAALAAVATVTQRDSSTPTVSDG